MQAPKSTLSGPGKSKPTTGVAAASGTKHQERLISATAVSAAKSAAPKKTAVAASAPRRPQTVDGARVTWPTARAFEMCADEVTNAHSSCFRILDCVCMELQMAWAFCRRRLANRVRASCLSRSFTTLAVECVAHATGLHFRSPTVLHVFSQARDCIPCLLQPCHSVAGKTTADGLKIYSVDELGVNVNSGGTPLCPFDCDCCF